MEVVSRQSTSARTVSTKLEWRIEQFAKLMRLFKNAQNLTSRQFGAPTVSNVLWELHVYPNGKREEDSNFVSFFLRQVGLERNADPINTEFKIYALDASGVAISVCKDVKDFTNQQGRGKFQVPREKLQNACLTDGSLNLICEVEFFPPGVKISAEAGDTLKETPDDAAIYPINIGDLLNTGLFSDCKFKVGNRVISSHRCILGLHSDVFRSMFEAEGMVEAQQGIIDITDSYYEPVHAMLQFMYNGSTEEVDKYPEDVLALAEKYAVLKLKDLCERRLSRTLNEKTICRMVTFADTFNAKHLKEACVQFLSHHHKKVLKNADWCRLRKEHSTLANELLETVLTGDTRSSGTISPTPSCSNAESPVKSEPGSSSKQPPRKRAKRK